MKASKKLGFELRLTYVILDSPGRSVERIKLRVAKGGHSVPKSKVVERYARSLAQLPWFLEQADQASLFDNSGARPKFVGRKSGGVVTLYPDAIPAIVTAVQKIAD